MAHFAQVENGIVIRVIVVANEAIDNAPFPESEPLGQDVISASGIEGTYVQCSYSAAFRGVYPGLGYTWDGTNFAAPVAPDITGTTNGSE